MKIENVDIRINDIDHIWYNNKQYISLNRVNQMLRDKRTQTHSCDYGKEGTHGNVISRADAIDARRYTFGNDEFSLEAAYHDCKLVFDGITDDDSFQEADTGLILYYANEIIYALQEALEGKDTNVPTHDCISRAEAIDAIRHIEEIYVNNLPTMIDKASAQTELMLLPSAQPESEQRPLTEDDYAYCAECDHVEMCRWYPMHGCEFKSRPSAEPEDWMEQNKDRILKAGMEGREVEFRIGGRLFAIREKAQ